MSEKWKLAGTYFEACSCDIACPCTFLSAPTTGECNALVGWHIDNGNFANINLNGLNVGMAVHSPGHMLEVKWRAALYLDETASEEQKNALTQIFTGQVGGHPAVLVSFIGEVLGIKSVPVEYEANGKRRRLKIADVLETEIEALDQGGADVTINNPPLGLAPGYPLVVAKSKKLQYKDHDLQWDISGKNGFYSPFTYQGD
ncbi:MAG: DUF1326 domain-containing protein [Segetibacter sp.]|nr:DUF1326 domain-containing protein [Segetibacter sp.]